MSDEPRQGRRGWGMADIPTAPKGECDLSRETPLKTYDCICESRMKAWNPKLYPDRKYYTHRKCAFQGHMEDCPDFKPAA